jgi:HlyD family secretion protein
VGWWLAPVAGIVAVGVGALAFKPWQDGPAQVQGTFFTVFPTDLEVKIARTGELQAIEYTDIKSGVEGVTTILELVKEGTTVRKGDKLIVLDSNSLTLRKEETDIALKKAEVSLQIALEMKQIQESQNAANKEAAQVVLDLAKLDVEQYEKGTYPQQLQNARTALEMAGITLKNKEEDLAQTRSLYAKGFVTATDVKKGELDVLVARNELAKATKALEVLETYSHRMQIATLRSAKAQSEQRYARVLREARSLLTQREADVAEKEAYLKDLQERADKLKNQIEACVIRAPEDGLVIFASTVDRDRDQIREGAIVRERQWLLRLPDVRAMKATLRVQEAQVPKLDVERKQRATVRIVGVPREIGATLSKVSVLSDSSQRWWNPDLKEYPVELTLDETPPNLKPGVGCQTEILVERHEQTLAVPLTCLYSVGPDSYVFARAGERVEPRKINVGATNETHVQVTAGLMEGDDLLVLQAGQGRELLERAGIKADPVQQQQKPKVEREASAQVKGAPRKATENATAAAN